MNEYERQQTRSALARCTTDRQRDREREIKLSESEGRYEAMMVRQAVRAAAASGSGPPKTPTGQIEENYLTPKEAAAHLRVVPQTICKLIRAGRIRAYRVGGGWRIAERHLAEYLSANGAITGETPEPAIFTPEAAERALRFLDAQKRGLNGE